MSVFILDRRLGRLALHASSDTARPFLTGIHVAEQADGSLWCEATDGAQLLRVIVPPYRADELLAHPAVALAADVGEQRRPIDVIVPTALWKAAFDSPILKSKSEVTSLLFAVPGLDVPRATFLIANKEEEQAILSAPIIVGQFPKTEHVLAERKTDPKFTITFDGEMLAQFLGTLSRFAIGSNHALKFRIWGAEEAVRIEAVSYNEMTVLGALAPMKVWD